MTTNHRALYEAVLKPDAFEQQMRIDYREDVLQIVAALATGGIVIAEEAAFAAWRRFSEDDRCATWYGLGNDDQIRRHLLPHLELRRIDGAECFVRNQAGEPA